jgi:type II secretory pathway pseudopilin PulG
MSTIAKAGKRTPQQSSWRTRDAHVTRRHGSVRSHASGFSLLELIVAFVLFAIMAGTALTVLPRNRYGVWGAQATLVSELRRARNEALTKGDHFRVRIPNTTTWETHRMTLTGCPGACTWTAGASPVRSGTFAGQTTVTSGVGTAFEFTTRGLMINPGAATTIVLKDPNSTYQRGVIVYPSGQVSPG